MHTSTKQRTLLFVIAATVGLLFGIAVVYRIGFGAMAATADVKPERLRDFTFSIWKQYPLVKHGFLTFLTADDFGKHKAYANEPLIYLWLMRALYQINLFFPKFTMRVSGAILSMSASFVAIGYVIPKHTWEKLTLRQAVLILLALGYFVTLPTFWISLGKFNVDNNYVLVFPILLILSCVFAQNGPHGTRFWVWAVLLCLFMPVAAAQFSLVIAACAVFRQRITVRMLRPSVVMGVIAVVVYLQPVVVAKLLGFSSENSTWLFRSGLDGDMTYYGNFINSILLPYFRRPTYLVLIPVLLLSLQLGFRRRFSPGLGKGPSSGAPDVSMPYLFSIYLLTVLFWPQAISIHPYLYDAFLVGPIAAWIVLNFAMPDVHQRHFFFWAPVLLFLIIFNLTKIAQAAHCPDCYFPKWDLQSERIG